jgi:biopolymer transport protein ExbB/TolQ
MRRFFTSVSTKAIERQNPDLASAIKKINPVASNPNPQAVQKAMSRLTPAERRAYMEAAQEQGGVPDTANRKMRRQAERMQQQARGGRPGGGGASSSRKRKRK